jgi:NAD(P)-dependent dehydrogenase (short-subunit alcohol dehydrogenase family)
VVKELRQKGVRAEAFKADQANAKEVEALVKTVSERFGRLDILVNNAGVFVTGQVNERPNNLAKSERLFAVNVGGVAAAVPVMRDGGRDHLHRLDCRRDVALAGHCRLLGDQGRRRRLYARLGARPRAPRHHREQRPARSHRYRYEPGFER